MKKNIQKFSTAKLTREQMIKTNGGGCGNVYMYMECRQEGGGYSECWNRHCLYIL
jgi:hypothetical protein